MSEELDQLRKKVSDLELQLAGAHVLLGEAQRLATIGTISAVVAHEFNNLLTPVVSYSHYALQQLKAANPDMKFVEKALTKAANGGEKAGKICASMLNLARGETTYGAVDVNVVVQETLSVLAREPAKDGIALRIQVPGGMRVVGDQIQLEQVMLNLLINARHAMLGKGGSLTVRAEMEGDGETGVIHVTDTGSGISPENLLRIWEPFFTTKSIAPRGGTKGTGLGLAICKEIVEGHKGSISVSSEPGRGTTFSVRLPMAAATAAAA